MCAFNNDMIELALKIVDNKAASIGVVCGLMQENGKDITAPQNVSRRLKAASTEIKKLIGCY